ncbi:hypothetical protein C8F01DRAFT_1141274 [Mycena amicta]|nr:hypothetical protein C8F01DRAFT_1141274 [Mycena amicta]
MALGSSLLVVVLAIHAVKAQIASPSWRKSNITTAPADRISIANGALQETISHLGATGQFSDADYFIPAIFYSQLAAFDIATNGTQYQDSLTRYFSLAQTVSTNFSSTKMYGYAAAQAYIAYHDAVFLQYAVEAWNTGSKYTLSQADVDGGTMASSLKNFPLAKTCQGDSMAGGTFSSTDASDPSINGLPTGLSALLAASTSDSTYISAAQLSTTFIHSHWLNTQNIVLDGISGRNNDSCALSTGLEPYDSGMTIEALAVLVDVTKDSSLQGLLASIIEAAITSTAWQGANGIISNVGHGSGGDLFLVRGLVAAYTRNVTSAPLKEYIKAYLAVQYNAVSDLARSQGNNFYGLWIGPAAKSFSSTDQTAALGVLVGAIGLHNESDATTSSSSSAISSSASAVATGSSTASTTSIRSHSHTGAIAGGVIGGVLFLVLALGLFFWCRRRRQRPSAFDEATTNPDALSTTFSERPSFNAASTMISPFTSSSPFSETSSSHGGPGTSSLLASASPPVARYGIGEKSPQSGIQRGGSPVHNPRWAESESSTSMTQVSPPARTTTSALPTAELVRILNSRLQRGVNIEEEDEAPPRYPETEVGDHDR